MTEHNIFTDKNPYNNIRISNDDSDEEMETPSREEYTAPRTNSNTDTHYNEKQEKYQKANEQINGMEKQKMNDDDDNQQQQQQQQQQGSTRSTQKEKEEDDNFWHRLSSIPLVQDSVGKVQQYPLGRFALKQAETTWTKASTRAGRSLPSYAQTYFEKADALGCLSLDVLEQRFPVVYQPTEQIVDTMKRSSNQVYDKLLLPVHQAVSLVDRFWSTGGGGTNNTTTNNNKQMDELTHLYETKAMLQETANHITRITDNLRGWTTCVASQVGSHLKDSYETTQAECNHRILELTTELVTKLDSASAYAKTVSIPPMIQTRLEPWVAFYDTMRNEAVNKGDLSPLQKASRMVILTQSCVLPALQSSIDGIQEQLKHYANLSKGKVMGELNSLGSSSIHASS